MRSIRGCRSSTPVASRRRSVTRCGAPPVAGSAHVRPGLDTGAYARAVDIARP